MTRNLTVFRMILREIQCSKWNTLMCLSVVALAAGLLVVMLAVAHSSVDATRILMRDMGFNLLITPPGADPAQYQALNFDGPDMPESDVEKLADSTVLAQHFVGKYQRTIQLQGKTVVLTGLRSEQPRQGAFKKPMPTAYDIAPGTVFVAAAAAKALSLAPGDALTLFGKHFKVARILHPKGAVPEDIRVFAHLADVQTLLGVEGRINAIDALACHCPAGTEDILASLEQSIRSVLPGVGVEPYRDILLARQEQRNMISRLELAAVAIVVAGSATAIWGLTYLNVRNRRSEIGVFCALGIPDRRIALLFLAKNALYGSAGGVAGCILGYAAAPSFVVSQRIILPDIASLALIACAAPIAAVICSLPPIVTTMLQDPADVLREAAA